MRVISAPLILDGPGRPGAGRSSCRCCAVMVVTRLKDAVAAVSRICSRGSPIPIFAQVRGILTIVMHRCDAAIGSAHGRAFSAIESHPPDPDRPHGGHSSLTARARCAQCSRTPVRHRSPPHPTRPRFPTDSRAGTITAGDIPRSRVRVAAGGGSRRRRGQQSRPPTRNTPPAGGKCPRTRRMSPYASEISETQRTLVVPNAARLPLSRGTGVRGWRPTAPPPTPPSSAQPRPLLSRLETADDR